MSIVESQHSKEIKTEDELAAMIQADLSKVDGCPQRGVSVTVYGLPWKAMLMFGAEAGPVRNKEELKRFFDVIVERLQRLIVQRFYYVSCQLASALVLELVKLINDQNRDRIWPTLLQLSADNVRRDLGKIGVYRHEVGAAARLSKGTNLLKGFNPERREGIRRVRLNAGCDDCLQGRAIAFPEYIRERRFSRAALTEEDRVLGSVQDRLEQFRNLAVSACKQSLLV